MKTWTEVILFQVINPDISTDVFIRVKSSCAGLNSDHSLNHINQFNSTDSKSLVQKLSVHNRSIEKKIKNICFVDPTLSWFYSPVIFNFRQPIIHRADSDVWAQKYIPGGQALVDDLPGVKVSHSVGRLSDELDFWDQRSFLTLYVDMFVHGYTPLTTETTSESNFVVASQRQNNSINVLLHAFTFFLILFEFEMNYEVNYFFIYFCNWYQRTRI